MQPIHANIFKYFKERELDEIYVTIAIRTFAMSMINIFIPIYLYEQGIGIVNVTLYYVFFYLLALALCYPISLFANKIGFKHSILISMPGMVLAYMMYYSYDKVFIHMPTPWKLLMLAVVHVTASLLFWMAFHFDFAMFTKDGKRGSEVGILQGITTVLNVFGPLLGGFLAAMNIHFMFIVASILMMVSAIPLFLTKEVHQKFKFRFKYLLLLDKNYSHFLAHLGEGLRDAPIAILWPLYIFISEVSVTSIGFIFSAAYLGMALLSMYVGKKSNTIKMRKLFLRIGSISNAIVIGLRALFINVFAFAVNTILGGMTFAMSIVPFKATFYSKASKEPEHIIFREIVLNLARSVILLFSIALFVYLPLKNAFLVIFAIAGAGTLLKMFIHK